MNHLRKHWADYCGVWIIATPLCLFFLPPLSEYQIIVWANFLALCLHQLEEYRFPGTFPGMLNRKVFKSTNPDRFPLNSHTALLINAGLGWSVYLLAAILATKAVWLGIATVLVSLGNIVAHSIVFNLKGKTWYNAGLITSWLVFAPVVFVFFRLLINQHVASVSDYFFGIVLGIFLNIFGVVKPVLWFAKKNSPYVFENRNLLPEDRKPVDK